VKTIQILGTGCMKCRQLALNAETAARDIGVEYELEKVTDLNRILSFGVMMTPGLVVDGQVKASGRVVGPEEIKQWLN